MASGFSYQGGRWRKDSATFNSRDNIDTGRAGVEEMDLVRAAVEKWARGGGQNYPVKTEVHQSREAQ